MKKLETKMRACLCDKTIEREYSKCDACRYLIEIITKVKEVVNSPQSGYEKRIALFDFLESLDVEELEPKEKKRVDYLLQSRLYSELAKQSMKEYKKLTVESFS